MKRAELNVICIKVVIERKVRDESTGVSTGISNLGPKYT